MKTYLSTAPIDKYPFLCYNVSNLGNAIIKQVQRSLARSSLIKIIREQNYGIFERQADV